MKTFKDLKFIIDANEFWVICYAVEHFPNNLGIFVKLCPNANSQYEYYTMEKIGGAWLRTSFPTVYATKERINQVMKELQEK